MKDFLIIIGTFDCVNLKHGKKYMYIERAELSSCSETKILDL